MKFYFCILSVFIVLPACGQFTTTITVAVSKSVGDDFQIYISLPPTYDTSRTYNAVYYLDANLKSGKAIRKLLENGDVSVILQNKIFIGIGHIGNYHFLRRRDFMIPTIDHNDAAGKNDHYGQAKKFLAYIKNELMPAIHSNFRVDTANNSLIGHSLGGLFVFYCLFQAGDTFANYFALSPSLWVNKHVIYQYSKNSAGFTDKKYLYFVAGSKEKMNKIVKGTTRMKAILDEIHFPNLRYEYDILKNKTHNSEVPVSLRKILTALP